MKITLSLIEMCEVVQKYYPALEGHLIVDVAVLRDYKDVEGVVITMTKEPVEEK